ncbi:MAG: sodium-dependent transporter [Lachnospiraceae bacterium]|nr:sodium-dependent transporter [Lachnospiraceae bacterium]
MFEKKGTILGEREKLRSRLGFILLSAGCAIGVGNVWKFPWMAGQYGGAAFVILYLVFLIILGLPAMTVEFSVGRAARKSPVLMYQKLTPKKKIWRVHGTLCLVGNIVLMMFYTIVAGWMVYYFVSHINGLFVGRTPEQVADVFSRMLASPEILVTYMMIISIVGFIILSFGLQKGLENVTKWMMIFLICIMIVLSFRSFTMSGAGEGLKFYLIPDFSKLTIDAVVGAMNQAFFTLSLGIGSMAIFGSYVSDERSLMGESARVIVLDTFVAITAGFIIFPACFTYNIEPGAGPSLIFITLPNIFQNMNGGRVWGSLFFLFMTFAAFSTVLAVFENILACVMDVTGYDRKKAAFICCIGIILLALPCALGFNIWSNIEPLGKGTGIMDLEDFIVSNILLPLGSLVFVLYATYDFGLGWKEFKKEANKGKGLKVQDWMRPYMAYVLPIIILVIFVLGIKPFIFK